MIPYILRRLLTLPLMILLVTAVIFLLTLRLPVEQRAAAYLPSGRQGKTEAQEQRVMEITIEKYGLDQPPLIQYTRWLQHLIQGDWGYSPTWRQPVLEGLRERVPATLELTFFAMVPAIFFALVLGELGGKYKGSLPDHLIRGTAFVGWAFPSFILGLMLMNVLYAWLGWFPPERLSSWAGPIVTAETFHTYTGLYTVDALLNGNFEVCVDALRHLVLPGITLAAVQWALLTRITRDSVLEVLQEDYITTARAKGVRGPKILSVHARPNSILPVISTTGVAMSLFLSNIVVIEVLFSFNGVGRWAVKAIQSADIPAVIGFTLFSCSVTLITSLTADILYAVIDPRVRLQ